MPRIRSFRAPVLGLVLLGCASPTSDRGSAPDGEHPAVAPVEHEPAAPKPPELVLWQAELDLDGDGERELAQLRSRDVSSQAGEHGGDPRVDIAISECVTDRSGELPCRGTLSVGSRSTEIVLHSGYFGGIGIRVIDIDAADGQQELLLTERGGAEEDPPYLFTIVQVDGDALRVTPLWHSNGYSSGTVVIAGDGVIDVRYDECPDAFAIRYQLRANGQLESSAVTSERVRDPSECAACPHVYVREATGFVYKGEILRELRRPELAAAQTLAFTRPQRFRTDARGVIALEIREGEPETSYIDALALELDGRRILPLACAVEHPAYCHEDGQPTILQQGDSLLLEFEVGDLLAGASVALWAVGYYEPH
jgi:hypothetical protein